MESIPQGISAERAQLLARSAAERAFLLAQFEGLDERALSTSPVAEGWTAAALLAHLAYWEAFAADRLFKLADGRLAEIRPLGGGDDSVTTRNKAMQSRFARLSFPEAVAVSRKERRNFLVALGRASDDTLARRVRLRPDWRATPRRWATWPHRHDAEHSADLVRWRRGFPPNDPVRRVIHRALLRPLLSLSREEFLTLAALVRSTEQETRRLEGEWTLKQLLGHLSDYERLGVIALKAVAAGREPTYDTTVPDFDAFNHERGAVWEAMEWDQVWATFLATRRALLMATEALPDDATARTFAAPWPGMTTPCGYLLDMAQHEQEHADGLRRALGLPPLPRRLGRVGPAA